VLRVGEMVIMLDYPKSKDWYVAEISQVLHDRFTVNGFITIGAPLDGYRQAWKKMRLDALKGIVFLRFQPRIPRDEGGAIHSFLMMIIPASR
jgi:hypothetical protein